ncbi:MAG: thioredoxin family protein [Pyrinomonadaceae bacterium]|nr:thioredoxin family protein [Phycisphaerales bacterium]
MMRFILVLAVLALSCAAVAEGFGHASSEPPAVFDKRSYTDAKKAADAGKKWFIVKATAVWCGPCKKMDATTWVDDKVIKWVKDNAVAVVVDVDKQQDIAGDLAIEAMPTMIAFKDGQEFDRVVGYKAPAELLEWLEGIARGEKSIEAVKKKAKGGGGGKEDIQARFNLAKKLVQDGQLDLATDEYIWLWQHMLEHNPAMYGVRGSFMARDMKRLAVRSKEATQKFTLLRDRTGQEIQNSKVDPDDLSDWLVLNNVIGDRKATLDWFDKVKDQGKWKPLLARQALNLSPILIEENRWADVARLYPDPMQQLDRDHELFRLTAERHGPDEETRKIMEESSSRFFRERVAQLYAALLAAAREKEAQTYADQARKLDDSAAMVQSLVSTALDAGQARTFHLDWLQSETIKKAKLNSDDEAALKDLRTRLDSAIKKGGDARKESK